METSENPYFVVFLAELISGLGLVWSSQVPCEPNRVNRFAQNILMSFGYRTDAVLNCGILWPFVGWMGIG